MASTCETTTSYFAPIDECVPNSISSSPVFLDSFLLQKQCTPANITTLAGLEALRYCTRVAGSLGVFVFDDRADFTALFDVSEIHGLCEEEVIN